MFTGNMINSIMKPGRLEPSLQFIVNQTTLHLALVNVVIAW